MEETQLKGRLVLVTGAARRIGRALALACAHAGADVVVHYWHAREAATQTQQDIEGMGRRAWIMQADLSDPDQAIRLIESMAEMGTLFGLVNSASIFELRQFRETRLADWDHHLLVNMTAPFLLTRTFATLLGSAEQGRVVNILDWRALRPGIDHFPYDISKAGLAAMTKSMALALAPNITVNGLALGAILAPEKEPVSPHLLDHVPTRRWGGLQEVQEALIFLLAGSAYITGEIIHVDGGRHLV